MRMLAGLASILVAVAVVAVALGTGRGRSVDARQSTAHNAQNRAGRGAYPAIARRTETATPTTTRGISEYCVDSMTGAKTRCSPRTPPSPIGPGFALSPRPGSPIKLVAQLAFAASSGASRPAAVGQVIEQGGRFGITIVGAGLPANSKRNAYAVWLTNGPRKAKLLGFVNPGVSKNGNLKTAGLLPQHAFRYHRVLITLETHAQPKHPGAVVLEGPLHR
ncbi:MAG: hypothetical protein M3065_00950 [Actinomycetota bacterium]|nr:hypothetical protein [Actinomycetota bacterium]